MPLLANAAAPSHAATGKNDVAAASGYEVVAQVIGAGGAPLAGANSYSMDAVIGQNNAALLAGTNGLSVAIGFWYVAEQGGATQLIFQNGFEASSP